MIQCLFEQMDALGDIKCSSYEIKDAGERGEGVMNRY